MHQGSPLPRPFPKSVEKAERSEREGQCWPTGVRSPTNTASFLNGHPLCHVVCWLLREAPVAQALGPEGAHLTHPTPLSISPWLSSLSFTLPFMPGPPPISISPAFCLSSSLSLAPVTQCSASQLSPPLQYFLAHLVHVGPPNPHLLPASLVILRHSEIGLDSSQIYPTLSSSKGSPLLGSKSSSFLTYQILEFISNKYEKDIVNLI